MKLGDDSGLWIRVIMGTPSSPDQATVQHVTDKQSIAYPPVASGHQALACLELRAACWRLAYQHSSSLQGCSISSPFWRQLLKGNMSVRKGRRLSVLHFVEPVSSSISRSLPVLLIDLSRRCWINSVSVYIGCTWVHVYDYTRSDEQLQGAMHVQDDIHRW